MAFNSRESVFKYLYGASRRAPGKRARYDFTKYVYLLRRWEIPGKRARYDFTKYVYLLRRREIPGKRARYDWTNMQTLRLLVLF